MTTAGRWRAAGIATFVLIVAACGGDDEGDTASTSTVAAASTAADDPTPVETPRETTDVTTDPTDASDTSSDGSGAAGDATMDEYVDAGAETMGFDDPEIARCIVATTLDVAGEDAVRATGLTPEEFAAGGINTLTWEQAQSEELAERLPECGDLLQLYIDQGATTEDEAACAAEVLDNELVGAIVAYTMTGLSPIDDMEQVDADLTDCLSG